MRISSVNVSGRRGASGSGACSPGATRDAAGIIGGAGRPGPDRPAAVARGALRTITLALVLLTAGDARVTREHRPSVLQAASRESPRAAGSEPRAVAAAALHAQPDDRTHRPPAAAPAAQRQTAWAIPYNGRFTFTRLMYGGRYGRRGGSSWSHDYPAADLNIPEILRFMTSVNVTTGASNVFTLDDPRLFQYPMLYISEPGFWTITDSEARNLRDYVLKGGFLVFDDFEGSQLYNMVAQLERALPGFELIEIGPDHEIFDSFFHVEDIYIPHPLVAVTPVYYGVFEDNDRSKRMLAIVNHNSDLAEYWEWSARGLFPVDITNEAYKLGVNYIVYSMTH